MERLPFRYIVPGLLLALCAAAWLWEPVRWALVALVPLAAIAVWDFFQHDHTLRRNYPLVARIRWLMEDLRPFAAEPFIRALFGSDEARG